MKIVGDAYRDETRLEHMLQALQRIQTETEGMTREQASAAQTYAEAARLDHAASERRYAEGEETLSAVLDKLAVRDDAEVKAIQASYGESLAAVQLRQAVGLGLWENAEGREK